MQKLHGNLIFGLHVHVGMESREMANHIANSTRYFLPHIYALSTNSPFWEGRSTGYKSFRTKVFDKFPRTGIPEYFESIEAYENFIKLLVKTNCIDNAKKIWWDLRVHPFFNTVEFRICDVPMTVESHMHCCSVPAVVRKFINWDKTNFIIYQRALINEITAGRRHGIDGHRWISWERLTRGIYMNCWNLLTCIDPLGPRTVELPGCSKWNRC